MTRYQSMLRIACLGLAACAFTATAQADDFYHGKTVAIVVGSSAGGGYDGYARFLAKYWGGFIPGHPSFVVRNMPGAGSLKATNYIYNVAPRDGTTIGGIQQSILFEPLFKNMGSGHEAKFDAMKLGFIGAATHDQAVMVVWHTTPFHSLADLKGKTVLTGSAGVTTNYAVYPRLMNATMGTSIKVIEGYHGTSGITLALERGELQAMTGWDYSSLSSRKRDWLLQKKVRVLVQFGAKKIPELPNVPLARNHTTTPLDRDVLDLITLPQNIGRPYVAPPDLPKERLQMLQDSFWAMVTDKSFLRAAKNAHIEISPSNAKEGEAVIKKGYAASPEVVAKAHAILVTSGNKKKK